MNFFLPVGKHRWIHGFCTCGNQESVFVCGKVLCIIKFNMILKEQGYKLEKIVK